MDVLGETIAKHPNSDPHRRFFFILLSKNTKNGLNIRSYTYNIIINLIHIMIWVPPTQYALLNIIIITPTPRGAYIIIQQLAATHTHTHTHPLAGAP